MVTARNVALAGLLVVVAALAGVAQAKQEVVAPGTRATAASASNASAASAAAAASADPDCCAPCPKCCPRSITYKHTPTLRKTCCCCGTKEIVLQVYDPCCCCCIDVPVCIPSCCCNMSVSERCGLLVRGVTTFRWDCGYKIKVLMGHKGNLIVHSYGR